MCITRNEPSLQEPATATDRASTLTHLPYSS